MSAAVVNKAKKIKLKNRSAKAVLLYLADCWSEKHGCFPTQERIAEDLEISLRTVKRSIKWLEQDGHIIRHFQTDGGRIIRTYYALFNGVTMTPLMVSPRHHQWCHHDTIIYKDS